MPLEDIFIQEMDRATSRLETVKINLDRQFLAVPLTEDGHWAGSPALYHWQNGFWYDTGGNPLDESEVPEHCRQQIEANPPTVQSLPGPTVTAVCRICKAKMNQSEIEQHYLDHYNASVLAAGSSAVPPPVSVSEDRPLTAKNTHRGG